MTAENNNIETAFNAIEDYWELCFQLKKNLNRDIEYTILIREEGEIRLVARAHHSKTTKGLSFYDKAHPKFQELIRKSALDPDTIIHTVGEEVKKADVYIGRVYVPSHVDIYESQRIVRDVTGFIL